MDLLLIILAAFLAALLTFFSGFGLGTILTPVFAIFFPIDVAIAMTAVVHFLNNVFKFFLIGKKADRFVLIRFGIPAIVAAFFGAFLLVSMSSISDLKPLVEYEFMARTMVITPVKLLIAILLAFFALADLLPYFAKMSIGRDKMVVGGLLSGFFGGLSGNQGALRSAFLINSGLSKETFVGTVVVISLFVDITRLGVYSTRFFTVDWVPQVLPVILATISAFAGAFLGSRLLKKVTLDFVQKLVAVMLLVIAGALGMGLI